MTLRHEQVNSDITVIGGGLAGCCAAIGAARQGAKVALVQNRPVLGGNSSSEVRVWVCGATAHGVHHYARETGVIGELMVENQFRNIEGNPYYWDLVLLEAVRDEPNIALFLNTDVRSVDAEGPENDRVIRSVTGWMMGSEREIMFTSPAFADCSGDGLIGFLAGAWYRTGCEAASEYGESWAPEAADSSTLGSTILFYSKDVGHPVRYVPPKFARDIAKTSIPERRIIRESLNGCDYWWIEWGGEKDVVYDNEEIRDELHAAIYGIWDYIKNSGKFGAENLTLEWVGSVPGKREYRRFVGDCTMTQHDVLGQPLFPDRIGFGGWSIDLHPPGGMYATENGSRHWHSDGNYHIPLRSLYSQNVRNMWMAGRNISCSHVAFGSTRVMATCGVVGEAAGTAAALAVRQGLTPRALATTKIEQVHHAMVRSDAALLGVENTDPDDLALAARVEASSTLRQLAIEVPTSTLCIETDLGMLLPVDPRLGSLELLLDATADTQLAVELYGTGKPQNYVPVDHLKSLTVPVEAGQKQWTKFDLDWAPERPQNAFIVIRANPAASLHCSTDALPGTLFFRYRPPPPGERHTQQWRAWKYMLHRQSVCFRLEPDTDAFDARHVIGGYARPYGGPHLWVSEPMEWDRQPWIELAWDHPVTFHEVSLIFDDEVEEDLINLHHHRTPYEVMPALARDYQIQAHTNGTWTSIITAHDNRRRHRVHELDTTTTTDRLRVIIESTNGVPRAHLIALRLYRTPRPH